VPLREFACNAPEGGVGNLLIPLANFAAIDASRWRAGQATGVEFETGAALGLVGRANESVPVDEEISGAPDGRDMQLWDVAA
jgi:hypothetical protein